MAGDLFGRNVPSTDNKPLTADAATIDWGGELLGAVQVSIQYAQQINRRRTIGNKSAVIWASMPQGQITIQRLMVSTAADIFTKEGFDVCKDPAKITLKLSSACGGGAGPTYTATGCIVSQYQVSAEAESLTVVDNVVIEFLNLSV